jgi:hypothetical protein
VNLLLSLKYLKPDKLKDAISDFTSLNYICEHAFSKEFPWRIDVNLKNIKDEVKNYFCEITALYILIRRACGFEYPNDLTEDCLNAYPLGGNAPSLKECLTASNVCVLCVPLLGIGVPPKLALRFYIGNEYYWQKDVNPSGQSYELADVLLKELNPKIQEEVFKYWIITGRVCGNMIEKVEIGNKLDLIKDFPKRRWMIPDENKEDFPLCDFNPVRKLSDAISVLNEVSQENFLLIVKQGDYKSFKKKEDAFIGLLNTSDYKFYKELREAINDKIGSAFYDDLLKAGLYDDLLLERCYNEDVKKSLEVFLKKSGKMQLKSLLCL